MVSYNKYFVTNIVLLLSLLGSLGFLFFVRSCFVSEHLK